MAQAADDTAYTMKDALKEARELLKGEFGEADQRSTVALATFLYGAHEKEQFLKQRQKAEHQEYV